MHYQDFHLFDSVEVLIQHNKCLAETSRETLRLSQETLGLETFESQDRDETERSMSRDETKTF